MILNWNGNEQLANGVSPSNQESVQSEAPRYNEEMELSEFKGKNASTTTETPLITPPGC
jgi:hypothetical protein